MTDFLEGEEAIPAIVDDYLLCAYKAGLGTYERGDPFGVGYLQIDFSPQELFNG